MQMPAQIPRTNLYCLETDRQQYWLNTITANREAGTRSLQLTEGASTSWDGIVKDSCFQTQSTYNELPPDVPDMDASSGQLKSPDEESPTADCIQSSSCTLRVVTKEREKIQSQVSK